MHRYLTAGSVRPSVVGTGSLARCGVLPSVRSLAMPASRRFPLISRYFASAASTTPTPAGSTAPAPPRRENKLAVEKSPYLLQHKHNPVDWCTSFFIPFLFLTLTPSSIRVLVDRHAWGEEAFARARQEQKPIFLSIGYSTCQYALVRAIAPPWPYLSFCPSVGAT
jgi:hypothetical protein